MTPLPLHAVNMAAASSSRAAAPLIKSEPHVAEEHELELAFGFEGAPLKRDPTVTLLSPVSGAQPLRWSEDHRLAVNTCGSLAVLELLCDDKSKKPELTLHRSSIPVPTQPYRLRVGTAEDEAKVTEEFSTHPDPTVRQLFLADKIMNPSIPAYRGIKYASWSPLGCDKSGRCLLACLTLDHRLTIHNSHKCLEWNTLIDLSKVYGERLKEQNYASADGAQPSVDLDFKELQRRLSMLTPLRMEWSSVYTVKQVLADNTCKDVEMVLLAVLMENGNLVLWKFELPFADGDEVMFYDMIESGVTSPSDLAWWEYESAERRMSGLIVGSHNGPIKILPVSLTGVKGYFTLRHPVILWQESDEITVENIKCVPIFHPILKSNCSLIFASRGCYVFWCLLVISPAGLNVHNSHVTGLHSLPIISLAVSRSSLAVYTCSLDGWIKKLTLTYTEKSLLFKQEDLDPVENLTGRRQHGMAISNNAAYMAIVSTQGMTDNLPPVTRTYQIHFVALKTPEEAAALLLRPPTQNLYRLSDLLDIVRCLVIKNKQIPTSLEVELDRLMQEGDSPYLWRFRLFLVRALHASLQSPLTYHRWKPNLEWNLNESLGDVADEEEEDGDQTRLEKSLLGFQQQNEGNQEGQMSGAQIEEVEKSMAKIQDHLVRENMKKVLGMVYLNTWTTPQISVPICGLMDYLTTEDSDRDAEVLIGHIRKKMNKQVFQEHCSLCQEVLPFTDHKQTVCPNGHMWLRCVLTYQACQALTFRRCLLLDSISRLPVPEDPEWIKKSLQAPCCFCDSPMI